MHLAIRDASSKQAKPRLPRMMQSPQVVENRLGLRPRQQHRSVIAAMNQMVWPKSIYPNEPRRIVRDSQANDRARR